MSISVESMSTFGYLFFHSLSLEGTISSYVLDSTTSRKGLLAHACHYHPPVLIFDMWETCPTWLHALRKPWHYYPSRTIPPRIYVLSLDILSIRPSWMLLFKNQIILDIDVTWYLGKLKKIRGAPPPQPTCILVKCYDIWSKKMRLFIPPVVASEQVHWNLKQIMPKRLYEKLRMRFDLTLSIHFQIYAQDTTERNHPKGVTHLVWVKLAIHKDRYS